MFKSAMEQDLKDMFDLPKVTFDHPGESDEQESLFVEVSECHHALRDGRQVARVKGKLLFFCNSDKMPFGYFQKKIEMAGSNSRKFFFGPEQNSGQIGNIAERSMEFVYFYDAQYNPKPGLEGLDTAINFQVGS